MGEKRKGSPAANPQPRLPIPTKEIKHGKRRIHDPPLSKKKWEYLNRRGSIPPVEGERRRRRLSLDSARPAGGGK